MVLVFKGFGARLQLTIKISSVLTRKRHSTRDQRSLCCFVGYEHVFFMNVSLIVVDILVPKQQ